MPPDRVNCRHLQRIFTRVTSWPTLVAALCRSDLNTVLQVAVTQPAIPETGIVCTLLCALGF